LAQTVFTCLYIHNPDFIEDPAMKAFALGILKICDIAREKVNKAAVFEEVRFRICCRFVCNIICRLFNTSETVLEKFITV